MNIRKLTVHGFLENSVLRYPDKIALIQDSLKYTYSEIERLVNNLARTLSICGVKQGIACFLYFITA